MHLILLLPETPLELLEVGLKEKQTHNIEKTGWETITTRGEGRGNKFGRPVKTERRSRGNG